MGKGILTWWYWLTQSERISRHAGRAITVGRMQGDLALGILATAAGTGIATFLTNAGQIVGTVIVVGALGTAVGRGSLELG